MVDRFAEGANKCDLLRLVNRSLCGCLTTCTSAQLQARVRQVRPVYSPRKHRAMRESCAVESMGPSNVAHAKAGPGGARVTEIVVPRDGAGFAGESEHEQPAVLAPGIKEILLPASSQASQ
jgi:murein endopeptidase